MMHWNIHCKYLYIILKFHEFFLPIMYQFHEKKLCLLKYILFIFLPACNSIRHPDEANRTLLVGRLIISYNELTEKTNENQQKNNNEKKTHFFSYTIHSIFVDIFWKFLYHENFGKPNSVFKKYCLGFFIFANRWSIF